MLINQLAVFLENKEGQVHEIARIMGENNVNMLTVSIADTENYGILRCITSDNAMAESILKTYGFNVVSVDLIGFRVDNEPGKLDKVLDVLDKNKINIGYMYSFSNGGDKKALILIKVDDNDKTLNILNSAGINLADDNII